MLGLCLQFISQEKFIKLVHYIQNRLHKTFLYKVIYVLIYNYLTNIMIKLIKFSLWTITYQVGLGK